MEIADYIIADDRVLVELVLQGDNIAFEYLFERYKEHPYYEVSNGTILKFHL